MVRDLYIPPSPSCPSKVYLVPRAVTSSTNSQAYSPVKLMSTNMHVGTNDIRERRPVSIAERVLRNGPDSLTSTPG
ncbi:hypothetical protein UPYG_G00084850 [Umbra pygmaea]|uniref:Uncharacterized protein n=1 Tax=Umbra pygmaea TaxID=75934 RepID=A0ABD0XEH9_UMBPY